jgi:hypothetical protein
LKTPAGLRLLRKLILGVLLLPVLFAALLAFFVWLDTDFHLTRQQIESSFKQVTGHNLVIKGGLALEFWPATRFVSRQVEVIDQQGLVLFTAEKLLAEVDPVSFVSGQLLGENLILEKVQINIVREATSEDVAQQRKHKMAGSHHQQGRITGVPFKSIRVIDSAIHIHDRINSKRYELNNLQVALELLSENHIAINSSLDFVYDNTFNGSLTSSSNLSLGAQLVFEQFVAQLDVIVHEQPLALKISGGFSLEPDGQLIQIREASFVSDELALRASLIARKSHDSLMIETEINHLNPLKAIMLFLEPGAVSSQEKALQSLSAQVKVQKSASEMRMDIASLQLDNSLVQGSMVFSDNSKHFQFKIDELVIDPYLELFAALPLEIDQSSDDQATETTFAIQFNRLISSHGTLEGLSTKAHMDTGKLITIQGNLNAKKLNPNGLLKSYDALIPESMVISKLQQGNEFSLIDGQLQFSFENEALFLSGLDLTIDDTLIKGDLEYSMNPPILNAQLWLGKLDLDRYHYLLVPDDEPSESSDDNEGSSVGIIQSLKRLQGSGSIQIEKLRYQQTDYQQIDIQFNDA